jgi:hypothetical protein
MTTVPNSVPDEVRCDHLILLVGGNPLPNYVAARMLTREDAKVSLIYSEGSESVADRLKAVLGEAVEFASTEPVDESRADSIQRQVKRALSQFPDVGVVGLHYTGGTKAMAVHTYRAVEAWAKSNNRRAIFSYLDARTHKIIFDSPSDEVYVGDKLALTLKEMLDLHGWLLGSPEPRIESILPKTARTIADAYVKHGKDKDQPYQLWKQNELYAKCKDDRGEWKRSKDLKQIKLAWPDEALSPIADALKEETGQHDQTELDIEAARRAIGLSEPIDFCKWLDGFWLEHRVLHALRNLPDDLRPYQALQGVKVAVDNSNFDLDVVAIFGYQLFGFTCGTATGKGAKGELKLKLFEGLLRTRQIGGDQARTALVCVYEDPDGLQAEARQQIDPDGQVRVFGLKHLKDLENELAHWIRSQRKQP